MRSVGDFQLSSYPSSSEWLFKSLISALSSHLVPVEPFIALGIETYYDLGKWLKIYQSPTTLLGFSFPKLDLALAYCSKNYFLANLSKISPILVDNIIYYILFTPDLSGRIIGLFTTFQT